MTARASRRSPRSARPSTDTDSPPSAHACEWPGCDQGGDFKAPKSRDDLRSYRWFCLEHVRAYNRSWNYYAGMTESEVEADLRRDTVWNRPSWSLGSKTATERAFRAQAAGRVHDGFGLFGDGTARPGPDPDQRAIQTGTPEYHAMRALDLEPPLTLETVKRRYKELVKRHHPDANGGDKSAEERFKEINQAYTTIVAALSPRPPS